MSNRRLTATNKIPRPTSAKPTTIHLREEDKAILEELKKMTGLKNGQVIRMALRSLLRRIKT